MIVTTKREKRRYYLFLLPAYSIFTIFIFFPMVYSFVLSLFQYNMMTIKSPKFIGLSNYKLLFKNPIFKIIMVNTIKYTVVTVPVSMISGLILALLVNHRLVKHKTFYKVANYIPYVSSMVAVSIVFSLIFSTSTNGLINQILINNGKDPIGWLSDANWALAVIMLLSIWKQMGYIMVIYTGGLLAIPVEIKDAAALDPVNPWQKLTRITLPLLRPTTLFLLVTQTIGSFQVFTPVQIMTGGGPGYSTTTIVTFLYQKGFEEYKMGMASAIAVIMFIILMILTMLQHRIEEY